VGKVLEQKVGTRARANGAWLVSAKETASIGDRDWG
jgi:hypothetical protein